jgi:hypothetical protein
MRSVAIRDLIEDVDTMDLDRSPGHPTINNIHLECQI